MTTGFPSVRRLADVLTLSGIAAPSACGVTGSTRSANSIDRPSTRTTALPSTTTTTVLRSTTTHPVLATVIQDELQNTYQRVDEG